MASSECTQEYAGLRLRIRKEGVEEGGLERIEK